MTPEIPSIIVSVVSLVAGIALLFSPMPRLLSACISLSFFYVSAIYGIFYLFETDVVWRMLLARAGFILQALTIVIVVIAYRVKRRQGVYGLWKQRL